MKEKITNFCKLFSKADVVYYSLIWLMVLVVLGTISQRYIGLYQAQKMFFSAWFFMAGFIPLPAAYPVMLILFLGLAAKLIFASPWKKERLGVNLVHFGAIMLLFGGFLTATFSQEGNMVIAEGERSNHIEDYYDLEFAIRDTSAQDYDQMTVFSQDWLMKKNNLKADSLPFEIKIINFCHNCQIVQRSSEAKESLRGFAKNFTLQAIARDKEEERNRSGVVFELSKAGNANGVYAVFEFMPIKQTVLVDEKVFELEIRHARRQLPFEIELIDFEEKTYAASTMAQSYKSVVNLIENGVVQRRVIQMNEPLRHRGYTFYQASFIEDQVETTVLAVVKNAGRSFPYISSIIMCIGLLVQLLGHVPKLIKYRRQTD